MTEPHNVARDALDIAAMLASITQRREIENFSFLWQNQTPGLRKSRHSVPTVASVPIITAFSETIVNDGSATLHDQSVLMLFKITSQQQTRRLVELLFSLLFRRALVALIIHTRHTFVQQLHSTFYILTG